MRKRQEDLTEKETEVLSLLKLGFCNREIAQKMFITEHTVKAHLTNIYIKLGVTNRLSAALLDIKLKKTNPHQDSKQP